MEKDKQIALALAISGIILTVLLSDTGSYADTLYWKTQWATRVDGSKYRMAQMLLRMETVLPTFMSILSGLYFFISSNSDNNKK